MSRYMITEALGSLVNIKPPQQNETEVLIEFSKDLSFGLLPEHIISLIENQLQDNAPWVISSCKHWMWLQTVTRRDDNHDEADVQEDTEVEWELDYDGYDMWDEWEDSNGYGSDGLATQLKSEIRLNRFDY